MKRKVYLAALVMCMALTVNGCGSDKETTNTESESTATEQQAEDSADEEEVQEPYTDSTGATRLVLSLIHIYQQCKLCGCKKYFQCRNSYGCVYYPYTGGS